MSFKHAPSHSFNSLKHYGLDSSLVVTLAIRLVILATVPSPGWLLLAGLYFDIEIVWFFARLLMLRWQALNALVLS